MPASTLRSHWFGLLVLVVATSAFAAEPMKIAETRSIAGKGGIDALAFADEGKTIVALCSGDSKFFFRGYKVDSGELAWEKPASYASVLLPDGKRALVPADEKLKLIELPSGNEIRS